MFVEDLALLFADFGVPASITVNGVTQTATVLFNKGDANIFADMQSSTDYNIIYPAASLLGIKHGMPIVVDGVQYTVREATAINDGALHRATLKL
ncbi:head-tail joining protein [Parvibium lacunae]|uniref:Uncharacterized protein n=1 Tax=Parvibium lacunae TaxID=1888893 RepID=A0A368L883_9BURK|nr:hypothetical protein [Parvibium lacunae]RCS59721.1 hypothetical protein DU000_03160 [Parvibium lacunae]